MIALNYDHADNGIPPPFPSFSSLCIFISKENEAMCEADTQFSEQAIYYPTIGVALITKIFFRHFSLRQFKVFLLC